LPEGALIKRICFYADDSDPDSAMFVLSHLLAIKQVPGGESPAMKIIGDDFVSQNLGYHAVCGDMTAPVRGRIDVDGDGIPDAVAYYVHVYFPAFSNPLGVGGMRITWKRQVSDPPPTPTFGDVRASDLGFPYIEALVSSGITAGCSAPPPPAPPLYCPDANLTRRQMAVFLAKALGLHWAESAP
jgi:hypothetical protein